MSSGRVLDPLERASEILFGVIMVLTFTGSIRVMAHGGAETRTVLLAAIGCNLAWGIVDAAMYLMGTFMERARSLATLRSIRRAREQEAAHRIIVGALPAMVSSVLTPLEIEAVRDRLTHQPEPSDRVSLTRTDLGGAIAVFLLVFLSTFPVAIPFVVVPDVAVAVRASNAIAIAILFATGWSLGRYAGRPGWRSGVGMVTIGVVLVSVTSALGG